ncbi:hypothetical protein [Rudanella lutea]|jgi:vacuolar-type H+-ATPase subunit I/STV1|uniref:hypothetical protein n=1 Tax=Rudanella lutea TaxID=451374 RepID=UPI0003741FD4|nr:hypothetical protein [Rudanella lutea]
MFTSLYELWLGQNDDPIYAETIFNPVGLLTLVVAFVLAAIFYLGLGRWKAVFYKVGPWVVTLIVAAVFGYAYALSYALDQTGADESDAYMQGFGGVNALYAVLYFVLFSFLLKRFSIYARRTPV